MVRLLTVTQADAGSNPAVPANFVVRPVLSSMANEKKSKQLGMAIGTANARLRKMVLFKLMQKSDLDVCFRCDKRIETIEEFSIEHKQPWLDVSAALFWDWDNIAFSHLTCNIKAGRKPKHPKSLAANIAKVKANSKKLAAPTGTSWCAGHKRYLPVEQFRKDTFRPDGLRVYCQECRK